MNPLDTLLRWLAPLLNPLNEFRSQVAQLDNIHQNSVQTFATLGGTLVESQAGSEAFTGQLEQAFWEDMQAFLNSEMALIGEGVGGVDVGPGVVLAEATTACNECVAEITGAAEVAAAEMAGDAVLDEVTGMVDVAAVAEAGANPVMDIGAIILTLIAGAAFLATLITLTWAIYEAVQKWQSAMHGIGDQPLPNLPPTPTPQPAPTPSIPPVNLDQSKEAIQSRLEKEFPDVPPELIAELIKAGLTEDQIRQFLTKHRKVIPAIWALLSQVLTIPGIEQLILDLTSRSSSSYAGAIYQLGWVVAHKDQIVRIEDRTVDGKRAIDAIMTNGDVVALKSYNWYAYQNKPGLLDKVIAKLTAQIERDKHLYPGHQIVFSFNSAYGPVPEKVMQALESQGVQVQNWP